METKPRADIKTLIVNPEDFVPALGDEKVRVLLVELDMLMEDYERENAIMYLASNYSTNKHLTFTALRSMHDYEIQEYMRKTKEYLVAEVKSRKNH